jgi:hypothetical protein
MLQGYTFIAITHEQAVMTVAESIDTKSKLDIGYSVTTIAEHPIFGDIMVVENCVGPSVIAVHRDRAKKFSN